jgi:hypothetical protein
MDLGALPPVPSCEKERCGTAGLLHPLSRHFDGIRQVFRFDGEYFVCFCKARFFVTLTAQELGKWDAPLAAKLLLEIESRLPAASMDLPAPAMILESVFPPETPMYTCAARLV